VDSAAAAAAAGDDEIACADLELRQTGGKILPSSSTPITEPLPNDSWLQKGGRLFLSLRLDLRIPLYMDALPGRLEVVRETPPKPSISPFAPFFPGPPQPDPSFESKIQFLSRPEFCFGEREPFNKT
jgi:hypothetical protein